MYSRKNILNWFANHSQFQYNEKVLDLVHSRENILKWFVEHPQYNYYPDKVNKELEKYNS